MIKIGFKKIQLICLIVLVLICCVQSQKFTATVTCQVCRKSCGVANCYRIASARFDYEQCPGKACELSINRTFTVDKCVYDYDGLTCPSKICLTPTVKQGCASRKLNITICDASLQNLQFKCISCTPSRVSCPNCLSLITTNRTGQLSNQCLGSTCNGVSTTGKVAAYNKCTVDVFGHPCSCCMTLINYPNDMFGQCLDNFPQFINGGFVQYALSTLESASPSGNNGLYMAFSAFLILFSAILL